MRFLWVIVVATLLSSCSAQYHLSRAVKKDANIARDTIVKLDTTIVTQEKILSDTIVVSDTIVREIVSESVRIRVQKIHDTIRIEATCLSDTISIEKEVEVIRYIKTEKTSIFEDIRLMIFSLIAFFAVVFLLKTLSNLFKN
jgi:ADP-glucose pyrophosphorylase